MQLNNLSSKPKLKKMKYIYLDTSHLIKWWNKKGFNQEIDLLNHVALQDEYIFVLSLVHGLEIANRQNRRQIFEIFKFLNNLRNIGFLQSQDLFRSEINHAFKIFHKEFSLMSPFVTECLNIEDAALFEETIDNILLSGDEQRRYHFDLEAKIQGTAPRVVKISAQLSKDKFKNIMKEAFRERIKIIINECQIPANEEFVNFIVSNRDIAPALKINFYCNLYYHRNKTKEYSTNDLFDVSHCSALPYVDYLSLDNESFFHVQSMVKKFNLRVKARFDYNLLQLFSNI